MLRFSGALCVAVFISWTLPPAEGFLAASSGRFLAARGTGRARGFAACTGGVRMAAGDLDISVSTVMGLETIVKRELEVISILQHTFLPFLPRLLCASSLLRKVLISRLCRRWDIAVRQRVTGAWTSRLGLRRWQGALPRGTLEQRSGGMDQMPKLTTAAWDEQVQHQPAHRDSHFGQSGHLPSHDIRRSLRRGEGASLEGHRPPARVLPRLDSSIHLPSTVYHGRAFRICPEDMMRIDSHQEFCAMMPLPGRILPGSESPTRFGSCSLAQMFI